MEFEWKQPIAIDDGQHSGKITKITYREEPYAYTDVWVSIDGVDGVELKYGCPSTMSSNSKLGRLMVAFSAEAVPGTKVDPEKFLKEKRCTFMTLKKKKEGKEFSEIVEDSLQPEKVEVQKI